MILVPITYKGGLYRHDEILDLIQDLGGYIIQKHIIAQDVILQVLVPKDDIELIKSIARPLTGEVKFSPLVGTEIAVVSMSLEIHHLPHASCDIAEYLRREGAKTNMVGLARGFGKRIANLNDEERNVINEHDVAIYLLGNFETCIESKFKVLRRGINVPIVVVGGPSREDLIKIIDPPVAGYVGGVGRFMHRTKEGDELAKLDEIISEVSRVVDEQRSEISKDQLSVSPARLMDVITEKIEAVRFVTSPVPVVVQVDGLRVKLPYDSYAADILDLMVDEDVRVADVADATKSEIRDYTLIKIKPFSETGLMV